MKNAPICFASLLVAKNEQSNVLLMFSQYIVSIFHVVFIMFLIILAY